MYFKCSSINLLFSLARWQHQKLTLKTASYDTVIRYEYDTKEEFNVTEKPSVVSLIKHTQPKSL